ncbi:MAG TPA: ubiquinol-cytochrome C chaperone family protein [Devosia sp.]|nr:ubiquinol-cytochrome C chaperone family protein [Devosia sp.]
MIFKLFRKSAPDDAVENAYASIVAQSRQPHFYADWGIPDSVTGRFDMISLHMALVLRRLKSEPAARDFGQALVDHFFRDMDLSLRELGITDLGVPKRVRKMSDVFYGLLGALDDALASGHDTEVEAVLLKNVFPTSAADAKPLAAYLLAEAASLAARPLAELVSPKRAGAAA